MKKIILVVVILAAIVTACGSADTPPTPDLTATEQIARLAETAQSELLTQAAPTPTIALAPTHTAAPAGGAAPTDAAVIVPTDTVTVETGGPIPAPPLGFSLGFAELGATNPATVDLSQGPQLVEYFAFWWHFCLEMAPVVHGLEIKYGEYMTFSYLDIDDPATVNLQNQVGYNYAWRPYILLIDSSGEVTMIFVGVTPPNVLEQGIQDLLKAEGIFN